MTGPACKTCNNGTLINKKVYRMSGAVVVIGYIFLIPSLIGLLVAGGLFFAIDSATKETSKKLKDEVAADLNQSGIPQGIITNITELKEVPSTDLRSLNEKQKHAVRSQRAGQDGRRNHWCRNRRGSCRRHFFVRGLLEPGRRLARLVISDEETSLAL
jgi:voltage-gated potassium channel Kch